MLLHSMHYDLWRENLLWKANMSLAYAENGLRVGETSIQRGAIVGAALGLIPHFGPLRRACWDDGCRLDSFTILFPFSRR